VRAPEVAASESAQATVEWIALVVVVSLLVLGLVAGTAARLPGTDLARAIAARLVCAVRLFGSCAEGAELVAAYGPALAGLVHENAPEIAYEDEMTALPVDFRSCRGRRCGNGPDSGAVWTSDSGEPAAAFVHTVDCRTAESRYVAADEGYDCSAGRSGNLYLQYWLYYEDSTSLRRLPGSVGHHEDDWEGYQVRIGAGGTDSRATSHHGYNYSGGVGSWLSDAGLVHRSAWGSSTGRLYVSGGSHAGRVAGDSDPSRWTPAEHLSLIPIETLEPADRRTRFAVDPPWRKPVYRNPEDQGT
jgi:hypothetical protein